jgi:hypothetical protein
MYFSEKEKNQAYWDKVLKIRSDMLIPLLKMILPITSMTFERIMEV